MNDWREIWFTVKAVLLGFGAAVLILLPAAWIQGSQKSQFIKMTQGIDVPWYRALFVTVTVNSVDVRTKP